jgi:hypothetical protein
MRGLRHAMRRRSRDEMPRAAPSGLEASSGLEATGLPAAGAGTAAADPEPGDTPQTRFAQLARVTIRHTFYNAAGEECRDFDIRPTGYTAALMQQMGMLLKIRPDGFLVLYDALHPRRLLSYLHGQVDHYGAWTRMTFLLSLRNPDFVSLTGIPIGTNPSLENFYLSNREAHAWKGATLLNPGRRVTAAQLLPVTGGQLVEYVDETVVRVKVRALSGAAVLCKPRCVTARAARSTLPDQMVCCDDEVPGRTRRAGEPEDAEPCDEGPGEQRCSDVLYFDLSTLPEDWYAVEKVGVDGPMHPNTHYLYTSLYPMPLCFVDLLFSNPDGGRGGMYPVTLAADGGGRVTPVDYTLRFTRRSTWWSYYVVPRDPAAQLSELRVEQNEDDAGPGAPTARFLGPCRVVLPGGQRAWRFLSSTRLPLEQRSTISLRLTGRVAPATHTEVLVSRLPVASPRQVLPMTPQAAWAKARDSLADPDAPDAACDALLRRLRNPGPDPRGRAGSGVGPPPECYSDIFVHV